MTKAFIYDIMLDTDAFCIAHNELFGGIMDDGADADSQNANNINEI